MPRRYAEATWDEVVVPEGRQWHVPQLLEARLQAGRGMILFGPPGTGKSSLAACVCGDVIGLDQPRYVKWEYAPTVLDDLGQHGKMRDTITRLVKPALLVLDDFGVARLTDWQVANLDKVVEGRYRERRSTIVTTNTDPAMLRQDEALARITDRWRQTMEGVQIAGPSRRHAEQP